MIPPVQVPNQLRCPRPANITPHRTHHGGFRTHVGCHAARAGDEGSDPGRRPRHAAREETAVRPKPMVEIGGKPILWHIMKIYSAHGVNDFVICLGYKGYVIKEYFANYFLHTSDVTFDLRDNAMEVHQRQAPSRGASRSSTPARHADRRAPQARPALPRRRADFCFTYGDGVADIDITAVIALPPTRRARWRPSPPCSRPAASARSSIDGDAHRELRGEAAGDGGWINGGFFVLSPEVGDYIEGDDTIWEREPLEQLARDGPAAAFTGTTASGSRWTRCATRTCSRSCGRPGARALEGLGMIDRGFWRGRRVLLTGHTGFQGRLAVALAAAAGRRGVRASRCAPDTEPALFRAGAVRRTDARAIGDVRDAAQRRRASSRERGPRSSSTWRRSRWCAAPSRAGETYATNVMGTVNLLDAVRDVDDVAGGRGRHHRQVLREPRVTGATARNDRWAATTRTRVARLRRARHRGFAASFFTRQRRRGGHGARRQRDRRRRLGAGPAGPGPRGAHCARASLLRVRNPRRRGRGSTCWTRSAATCRYVQTLGQRRRGAQRAELRSRGEATRDRWRARPSDARGHAIPARMAPR